MYPLKKKIDVLTPRTLECDVGNEVIADVISNVKIAHWVILDGHLIQ